MFRSMLIFLELDLTTENSSFSSWISKVLFTSMDGSSGDCFLWGIVGAKSDFSFIDFGSR